MLSFFLLNTSISVYATESKIFEEIKTNYAPLSYELKVDDQGRKLLITAKKEKLTDDEKQQQNVPGTCFYREFQPKMNMCVLFADKDNKKDYFNFFIDTEGKTLNVNYVKIQTDLLINASNYSICFGSFLDNENETNNLLHLDEKEEDNNNNQQAPTESGDNASSYQFSSVLVPGNLWIVGDSINMEWCDINCNWLRCDTRKPFKFGKLFHKKLNVKNRSTNLPIEEISYGFSNGTKLDVKTDLMICSPSYQFISGKLKTRELYLMDSFDLCRTFILMKLPKKEKFKYEDLLVEKIENLGTEIDCASNFWFRSKEFIHKDLCQEVKVQGNLYYLPLCAAPITKVGEVYCDLEVKDVKVKQTNKFPLQNVKFYGCFIRGNRTKYKQYLRYPQEYEGKESLRRFVPVILQDIENNFSLSLSEVDLYENFLNIKNQIEQNIKNLINLSRLDENQLLKNFKGQKRQFDVTPDDSDFWQELVPFTDEIYTNGEEGQECKYYIWNQEYNDIDAYNFKGEHLGCIDPTTGQTYHGKIKTLSITIPENN